jgi:glycosyltransferase involved in cell wall biosynthesis
LEDASLKRLRLLVLGPDCNPQGISTALVSFSHAAALARIHDVTIAVRAAAGHPAGESWALFEAVASIRTPWLDRPYEWCFRRVLKSNYSSQWRTALGYPRAVAFEIQVWRKYRKRIRNGDFDAVIRLSPVSAAMPSPISWLLRRGPIPFVIGPVNGGLPWPSGFPQAAAQREFISRFRDLCRAVPFGRSTYRHAKAILAGSSRTYKEFERFSAKLFFVPENGVDAATSGQPAMRAAGGRLEAIFVAGLVPIKGCDIALRAVAPLARQGEARLAVLGDGPERARLEHLARSLGIEEHVEFAGWVPHAEVLARLRRADVLLFPSIRDFGGGAVFEALASGAVPIVADFGGPSDIVPEDAGFKVPLTNEGEMAAHITEILGQLAGDGDLLGRMRARAVAYAKERLTWEAKARQTTAILEWVAGKGPKPHLPPPKIIAPVDPFPASRRRTSRAAESD